MNGIIVKPIITEKVSADMENNNRYGFIVDKTANKIQIKSAIETLYSGVSVISVNTMNYGGGKKKMKYTQKGVSYERNHAYKKALVTLREGDVIDFYSQV